MNMRETTTKFRLANWTEKIRECGASGETIKNFCLKRGITKKHILLLVTKAPSDSLRTACRDTVIAVGATETATLRRTKVA